MVSRDLNFIVYQLGKRVDSLEQTIDSLKGNNILEEQDWDDAMLQRKWNVCRRTTAYYRKNGLEYYKRGGRIYYTRQNREEFLKQKKS